MKILKSIQLFDLPDEILLLILKKLNIIDLFKIADITIKCNNILYDPSLFKSVTLFKWSSNNNIYSFSDLQISHCCLKIVPKIHKNIKWLNLEYISIDRILSADTYPNLVGLGIYNIDINGPVPLFNRKNIFYSIMKNSFWRFFLNHLFYLLRKIFNIIYV